LEAIVTMQQDTREQQSGRAALSVTEFCVSHGISRALFYLLLRDGSGPRVMRVRGRVLISIEAAGEWRQRMEREVA
jgi:hypothetical protein